MREDRENAVAIGIRRRDDPFGDFSLQHQDHADDPIPRFEQVEQEGRRNVVRQIGDDDGSVRKRVVCKAEGIGMAKIEIRAGQRLVQITNKMRIDFKRNDRIARFAQAASENATAGADLQHGLARLNRRRSDDLSNDVGIDEKVLSEAFLW